MPGSVFHPDHTAHIRARLKHMAAWGVFGLVTTALAAGILAIVVHGAAEPPPAGLIQAVWIAVSVLVAVSLLDLALVAVFWGIYRLRRAELDAEGAEVVGELRTRAANARRIDS